MSECGALRIRGGFSIPTLRPNLLVAKEFGRPVYRYHGSFSHDRLFGDRKCIAVHRQSVEVCIESSTSGAEGVYPDVRHCGVPFSECGMPARAKLRRRTKLWHPDPKTFFWSLAVRRDHRLFKFSPNGTSARSTPPLLPSLTEQPQHHLHFPLPPLHRPAPS